MIIPYDTDAPLYHFPVGTLGLIALNVLVFLGTGFGDDAYLDYWGLWYGDGLHPLTWFTSLFLHKGFIHLVGNMLFLWGFGIIVEGKLGWLRFLAISLGLGIVECALEQILTLGMSKSVGSVGASAMIYGLMAMTLVWAPMNELKCVLCFYPRRYVLFNVAIWKFSVAFFCAEVLMLWITRFTFTSSVLHLSGAGVGFALAAWMFRTERVNCDGWDLFSVLQTLQGTRFGESIAFFFPVSANAERKAGKRKYTETEGAFVETASGETEALRDSSQAPAKSLRKLHEALAAEKGGVAYAAYLRIRHLNPDWKLPEQDLFKLIEVLLKDNDWGPCVPLMEDYIARPGAEADEIRLRLVKILITEQCRPSRALRVLGEIPTDRLPPSLEQIRAKLESQAQQLLDQGVLELDGEAWL